MPTQTIPIAYQCGHTLTRTFPTTLPAGTTATVYEACDDCKEK